MEKMFQLYLQVNAGSLHPYPYAALSADTDRLIHFSDENIAIAKSEESWFIEMDYVPTSRFFPFPLDMLDQWVEEYTGQREYMLVARFTEHRHVTLTYHSPTNEGPKDYHIFEGYPDPRAEELIGRIYSLLEDARRMVWNVP